MRLRLIPVASLAATALVLPLGGVAHAVTTTSTQVVFEADPADDGSYEIYTMAADGSTAPSQLFATATDTAEPALSPNGTQLAYVEANASTFSYNLKVRAANGSGSATTLTTGDEASPAWSPDGQTIAFTRYNVSTDAYDLYTIPAAGGSVTPRGSNAGEPAFSPSGRQIATDHFGSTGTNAYVDLVSTATNSRAKVAGTDGGSDPVFSPDGQTIVFVKQVAACQMALYSVPVGGGTPTVVRSVANTIAWAPEFSDDGTQLFWSEATCGSSGDVMVANADGSSPAVVRATTQDEGYLSVAGGTVPALETTAPAAPAIASATVAATSAALTWTESSTDASEYAVVRVPLNATAPATPADGTLVYDGAAHSATATGLTTGTAYDFYVFAYDASGNLSAASVKKTVQPVAIPVLTTIGLVSSLRATATFPVTWTGSATSYQLNVGEKTRSSTGVWSSAPAYVAQAPTTAKSKSFAGAQGHTYYFQVRAFDAYGNPTAYTSAKSAIVPVNENSSVISYTSGWTSGTSSSRWLGTFRYATGAGKYLSFKTETNRFVIVGDKCAACGQMKVYVDGVLKATVDTHASSTLVRQVLYAGGTYTSIKSHTLKIVVVGTAGRPRVLIDGIARYR